MAFEKFVPSDDRDVTPFATIRPTGLISFDGDAVEAFDLDKFTHASLFFDKTRKLIGVQRLKKGADDSAHKLSKRRRSMSLKSPQFFDEYNIILEGTIKLPVYYDAKADLLVIVAKELKRRRGRRAKRR